MEMEYLVPPSNRQQLYAWFNDQKKHSGTLLSYFLERYIDGRENSWVSRYAIYKDKDKLSMKLSMSTIYNALGSMCSEGYIDYEQRKDGKFYARLNPECVQRLDEIACLLLSRNELESELEKVSSKLKRI